MISATLPLLRRFLLILLCAAGSFAVQAQEPLIGIVVMHGKGGGPKSKLIAPFANALERKGLLVANLNMPWSGTRNYDVPVERGEEEVRNAVAALRARGARKVFVAGHSQGGAFALHMASTLEVDGIICIAPGGDVSGRVFRDSLGDMLELARQLVADGKGEQRTQLADYENPRDGRYPITAIPSAYVTWFDPDGAMNMTRAARAAKPGLPFLWIAPTNDYPGLRKAHPELFRMLPANPRHRFAEPSADHREAPVASVDEIERWTKEIAAK